MVAYRTVALILINKTEVIIMEKQNSAFYREICILRILNKMKAYISDKGSKTAPVWRCRAAASRKLPQSVRNNGEIRRRCVLQTWKRAWLSLQLSAGTERFGFSYRRPSGNCHTQIQLWKKACFRQDTREMVGKKKRSTARQQRRSSRRQKVFSNTTDII